MSVRQYARDAPLENALPSPISLNNKVVTCSPDHSL